MSGHSKWHNIQKTKGAADAKRAQAFTKIAREEPEQGADEAAAELSEGEETMESVAAPIEDAPVIPVLEDEE